MNSNEQAWSATPTPCSGTETYSDRHGDKLGVKPKTSFRLAFQNINGLGTKQGEVGSVENFKFMRKEKIDIWGWAEVNVNWRNADPEDSLRARMNPWFKKSKVNVAYNKHATSTSSFMWGGTAVLCQGLAADRTEKVGRDATDLGRWAWVILKGSGGVRFKVYSAYRPHEARGVNSVGAQHQHFFNKTGRKVTPISAFWSDLECELARDQESGMSSCVMIDANADIRSNKIQAFFKRFEMREVNLQRHGLTLPPSHSSGSSPIDGIFLSDNVQITSCGILQEGEGAFNADHRLLWLDCKISECLGEMVDTQPYRSPRRLNCSKPRCVEKYTKCLNEYYNDHSIMARVQRLDYYSKAYEWTWAMQQELEAIDYLRAKGIQRAERKCRKIRAGLTDWFPGLQKLRLERHYWRLCIKQAKGGKVQSRVLYRLNSKLDLKIQGNRLSLEELNAAMDIAHKKLAIVSKNEATHRREAHLASMIDMALISDDRSNKARLMRQMAKREETKRVFRNIKAARIGEIGSLSVDRIEVQDADGTWSYTDDQATIESELLKANFEKLQQTRSSPLMQRATARRLGWYGETQAAARLLAGKPVSNIPLCNQTELLFASLQQSSLASSKSCGDYSVSLDEWRALWKKSNENTASANPILHFGVFKANAMCESLAKVDFSLVNISLQSGHYPQRWESAVDVMLIKKPGVLRPDKFRTIVLMQADYNAMNKMIGRKMMEFGEDTLQLAKEQFGSRKLHSAAEQALNKRLTFDLMRQSKMNGALCSNDAKSCYDRIVLPMAGLALRRNGIASNTVVSMLRPLSNMTHKVSTAFGLSAASYGGNKWSIPPSGIGQGNGAGPQLWAGISSPLFDSLRQKSVGIDLCSPLSGKATQLAAFGFVDDTDIPVLSQQNQDTSKIKEEMQQALDIWESLISATGGALEPAKSFWYQISFIWHQDRIQYSRASWSDANVWLKNSQGEEVQLERVEPSEARKTLGVYLAPNGSQTSQIEALKKASTVWSARLRTSRLRREWAWISMNTTILKTVEYPLLVTSLDMNACNSIMSPMLQAGLPKAGICRNFPRALVFARKKFLGLGLKNIHTTQFSRQAGLVVQASGSGNTTAALIKVSLEYMVIESGLDDPLGKVNPYKLQGVISECWLFSLWQFLWANNIQIFHNIRLPLRRKNDELIMRLWLDLDLPIATLYEANLVRVYLRVYTLSHITTGDGSGILPCVRSAQTACRRTTAEVWPIVPKPSIKAWNSWTLAIALITRPDRQFKLRKPLGDWFGECGIGEWVWQEQEKRLLHREVQGFRVYEVLGSKRARRQPSFRITNLVLNDNSIYGTATMGACLTESADTFMATGKSKFRVPTLIEHDLQILEDSDLDADLQWMCENFAGGQFVRMVPHWYDKGILGLISDGSFVKGQLGTASWAIFNVTNPDQRLSGSLVCPGPIASHSAYRCELAGIYAVLSVARNIMNQDWSKPRQCFLACDGLSALQRIFDRGKKPTSTKEHHFDLLSAIRTIISDSQVDWIPFHVRSHQSDFKKWEELSMWEQQNELVDRAAQQFRLESEEKGFSEIEVSLVGELWPIYIKGKKVTGLVEESIYNHVHDEEATAYWDAKIRSSNHDSSTIDWHAMEAAAEDVSVGYRQWIAKHAVGMCGVGSMMVKWRRRLTDICPRCGEQNETAIHVAACLSSEAEVVWKKGLVSMSAQLKSMRTAPDLQQTVLVGLKHWRYSKEGSRPSGHVALRTPSSQALWENQSSIGWDRAIFGQITSKWSSHQQAYYESCGSRRSGRLWASRLIRLLWALYRSMWVHRNTCLHNKKNQIKDLEDETANTKIRFLFDRGKRAITQESAYLFRYNQVEDLLHLPIQDKKEWINQVEQLIGI